MTATAIACLRKALDTPAPVLDWKDQAAYAFLDAVPSSVLAWEFLRRSPEYRADVTAWFATCSEIGAADFEMSADVVVAMTRLCEKWYLWPIYGPGVPTSCIAPGFKDLESTPRSPVPIAQCFGEVNEDLSVGYHPYNPSLTIRFHLDQPINEQLKSARALIELHAEAVGIEIPRKGRKDTRRVKGKYPRYAQLLDARLEGVRPVDMAREFYGPDKDAEDALADDLNRADFLSSEGYLDLFWLSEPTGK